MRAMPRVSAGTGGCRDSGPAGAQVTGIRGRRRARGIARMARSYGLLPWRRAGGLRAGGVARRRGGDWRRRCHGQSKSPSVPLFSKGEDTGQRIA